MTTIKQNHFQLSLGYFNLNKLVMSSYQNNSVNVLWLLLHESYIQLSSMNNVFIEHNENVPTSLCRRTIKWSEQQCHIECFTFQISHLKNLIVELTFWKANKGNVS
jgi:hypothetical protein